MPLFERDDVATPYSVCKFCKKPTRSHVLEPAKYEEFKTEIVINSSDEFANNRWEEVEEVVKARKAVDPIVVCHICWLTKKDELYEIIHNEKDEWRKDPVANLSRIHSIAHAYKYYEFKGGEEEEIIKELLKELRQVIKNE